MKTPRESQRTAATRETPATQVGDTQPAFDDERFTKHLVRSRRPAVLRRLHAIDATRVHLTMTWVVSFSSLRPFGPI